MLPWPEPLVGALPSTGVDDGGKILPESPVGSPGLASVADNEARGLSINQPMHSSCAYWRENSDIQRRIGFRVLFCFCPFLCKSILFVHCIASVDKITHESPLIGLGCDWSN